MNQYKPEEQFSKIKLMIQNRGGTLLSSMYNGTHGKLEILCSNGHNFLITPTQINQNSWCKFCKKFNRS